MVIKLKTNKDKDITFELPNGEEMVFQWRIESQSIDLNFENDKNVYVQDGNLNNIKKRDKTGGFAAKQITIL